ncbi:MAG: hypothetical protein QOF02_2505 [Blastocatellia bacterium]|jgi:hypothetical protein|nr:hypothetical protein [Blastocatellia bacterium]
MATLAFNQLSLAPLGAGDLIDRAVRLYRRHFMTLIRIAAPPVIVSAIGSMLWTIAWRGLVITGNDAMLPFYGMLVGVGILLTIGGMLLNLIVMGGAARNLVTHLLWNEPVTARATYRNVRSRFWGLLVAAIVISIFMFICGVITMIAWSIAYLIVVFGAVAIAQVVAWLGALVGIIGLLTITLLAMALFFLMAGRVAYVPQVMLVEGKGVAQALTRSFGLARGNVRRLLGMFLFTSFAAYSALMVLIIPLGWYGYLNGVDPSPWNSTNWPTWYAIGYSVFGQLSSILLLPVWMLGLSLLYVDERVRHEGYDIELMAARQMGAIPEQWNRQAAPNAYTPAIVTEPQLAQSNAPDNRSPNSTLGLR